VDHKWLEDFIMLAREKSFSKAAELRHITQPQFSRRIRSLEMWAGSDLINRASVPLSLTPAGEELLAISRQTVSSLSDLRARLRSGQDNAGWITLATGRTLARTAVPTWFTQTRRATGEYRLRLITGSISEGVTALEQGAADFLLSYTHPRLPLVLDDAHFESKPFGRDELLAVSAPQANGQPLHALPGSAKNPVATLNYTPTLALAQVLQDGIQRLTQSNQQGLHLHTIFESDFAESLHEQALQGAGMGWLPRSLVHADLQAGKLVHASHAALAIPIEFRLFRPRKSTHTLASRVWDHTPSFAG
jgi:LysR family transcriptional regulator, hypochlorite-specific transcription factor HypT